MIGKWTGLNQQLYALTKRKTNYIIKKHEKIFQNLIKKPAWDYTLGFSLIKEGAFGIIPTINLVQNIGSIGEHNKGSTSIVHNKSMSESNTYSIQSEPPFIVPDYKYDQYFFHHMFYKTSLFQNRIRQKFVRLFNKIANFNKKD